MNKMMEKKDVAKALGVSTKTIERLVIQRNIPFFRVPMGRSIRFEQEAIERWVKCNTTIERVR